MARSSGWRDSRGAPSGSSKAAGIAARLFLTVLTIGLVSAFLFVVFRSPEAPPGARIYCVSTAKDHAQVPPLPFHRALVEDLGEIFGAPPADEAASPAQAALSSRSQPVLIREIEEQGQREFLSQLKSGLSVEHPRDTLVVYCQLHVVQVGDEAHLLCADFAPSGNKTGGRPMGLLPVGEVVDAMQQVDAACRILLLDAGTLSIEPQLGIYWNDFLPGLVKASQRGAAVASSDAAEESPAEPKTAVPTFVMVSHCSSESSRSDFARRSTLFSAAIAATFRDPQRGDANQDGHLTVMEFYRSVLEHSLRESAARSGPMADDSLTTQTPVLLEGGRIIRSADDASVDPILLTQAAWPVAATASPPEAQEKTEGEGEEKPDDGKKEKGKKEKSAKTAAAGRGVSRPLLASSLPWSSMGAGLLAQAAAPPATSAAPEGAKAAAASSAPSPGPAASGTAAPGDAAASSPAPGAPSETPPMKTGTPQGNSAGLPPSDAPNGDPESAPPGEPNDDPAEATFDALRAARGELNLLIVPPRTPSSWGVVTHPLRVRQLERNLARIESHLYQQRRRSADYRQLGGEIRRAAQDIRALRREIDADPSVAARFQNQFQREATGGLWTRWADLEWLRFRLVDLLLLHDDLGDRSDFEWLSERFKTLVQAAQRESEYFDRLQSASPATVGAAIQGSPPPALRELFQSALARPLELEFQGLVRKSKFNGLVVINDARLAEALLAAPFLAPDARTDLIRLLLAEPAPKPARGRSAAQESPDKALARISTPDQTLQRTAARRFELYAELIRHLFPQAEIAATPQDLGRWARDLAETGPRLRAAEPSAAHDAAYRRALYLPLTSLRDLGPYAVPVPTIPEPQRLELVDAALDIPAGTTFQVGAADRAVTLSVARSGLFDAPVSVRLTFDDQLLRVSRENEVLANGASVQVLPPEKAKTDGAQKGKLILQVRTLNPDAEAGGNGAPSLTFAVATPTNSRQLPLPLQLLGRDIVEVAVSSPLQPLESIRAPVMLYPGRRTEISLQVRTPSGTPRKLRAALLATEDAGRVETFLSREAAAAGASGEPAWPFRVLATGTLESGPAYARLSLAPPAPAAAAAGSAPPPVPEKPAAPLDVSDGLVLALTEDPAAVPPGCKPIRAVERLQFQHVLPDEFLEARATLAEAPGQDRKRLEIAITPRPTGGGGKPFPVGAAPVEIDWDSRLANQRQGLLGGESEVRRAVLYGGVPADASPFDVALAASGYPRAFVFKIDPAKNRESGSQRESELAITVTGVQVVDAPHRFANSSDGLLRQPVKPGDMSPAELIEGPAYFPFDAAKPKTLRVDLEISVPYDSPLHRPLRGDEQRLAQQAGRDGIPPRDVVRLRLASRRDPETPISELRLFRQLDRRVEWHPAEPGGGLLFACAVRNPVWEIASPPENDVFQIVPELTVHGRTIRGGPIEVVLDNRPPDSVQLPTVTPSDAATRYVGPFSVSVRARDGESGVNDVTFQIFHVSTGKALLEAPLRAQPLGDERWGLLDLDAEKLGLEAGRKYRLVATAVDQVGLETRSAPAELLFSPRPVPEKPAAMPAPMEEAKPKSGEIRGYILKAGRNLKGARITIQIVGTKLKTAVDREGHFQFADVPLGSYKVVASGTFKGIEHAGELEGVAPIPKGQEVIEIEVPVSVPKTMPMLPPPPPPPPPM